MRRDVMETPSARRAVTLAATGLAVAATLTGCVYRTERTVPAASPSTVVVTTPQERVVTYPEGRWELRGGGTAASPYYWIWIPQGTNPPMPPAPPAFPR
jgi:hypothetical protein